MISNSCVGGLGVGKIAPLSPYISSCITKPCGLVSFMFADPCEYQTSLMNKLSRSEIHCILPLKMCLPQILSPCLDFFQVRLDDLPQRCAYVYSLVLIIISKLAFCQATFLISIEQNFPGRLYRIVDMNACLERCLDILMYQKWFINWAIQC